MDGRDRLLITLGIIGIIALALITSFGRNFFAHSIPSVVLPNISTSGDPMNPTTNWEGNLSPTAPVTVTTDTVQAVVDSLQRADSYFRTLSVELFWEGGSSVTPVSVWCNGGWTSTQQTQPTGLVRNDLVGEDTRYYWYSGDDNYLSISTTEGDDDLSQRIPTYEDVVKLDSKWIVSANYAPFENIPAIYVEVTEKNRTERYWVSTDSGLLIGAEVEEDGQLIYRLTAIDPVQIPCPTDAPFSLPDGTAVTED